MIKLLKPLNSYWCTFNKNLLISVLIFISGCSKGPEETLCKYLDHTFVNYNGKKAYRLLSSDDKILMTEKEFTYEIKRKNILNQKLRRKHKGDYTYKILGTKYLSKDTVVIKVSLRKPNPVRILHQKIPFSRASSIFHLTDPKSNRYMLQKQYKEILDGDEIQIEQEVREFTLIREKKEYKLFLNFNRKSDKSQEPLDKSRNKHEQAYRNKQL